MQQAFLPFNEPQRLKALQDSRLVDSPDDPRFERLAQAAAEAFAVPMAAITFIDETRAWNKAAVGLPFPKFREVSRANAFSAHAILTPGQVFVVGDASADARFADCPAVVSPPFVRFFAAVTVRDEAGLPIGTLSVADHTPRGFSEKEQHDLLQFAAQADLLVLLHESQRKLGSASTQDGLTGLGNRRLFNTKLESFVESGNCALLVIDLEHFAAINDDFGHIAGDAVLCETARRLKACAGPRDVVLRLGGDEFAVLASGPLDAGTADILAQRIVEDLERPFFHSGTQIEISACVGVALCPEDAGTPATLARRAELARSSVSEAGHAKFGRAGDPGESPNRPPRSLEWDLMRAMEKGEFELHWQPIVDLRRDALHGYEAFLRWNRPDLGEVSPARFLPAAERSGLITGIDAWALREACSQAARWRDPVNIAVNVSAEWLGRRTLPETVARVLSDTGVAPARLEIDITEGLLNRNTEQAARDIGALKDMGVRIALDDFGAGLSSLSYLKDFPFDMMKLHRSFTQDLRTNPRAAAVADAAIALGRMLGITVSAEGVEELWHLEFLRKHGCDLAQGYLFGRPSKQPREPGLPGRVPAVHALQHMAQSAA